MDEYLVSISQQMMVGELVIMISRVLMQYLLCWLNLAKCAKQEVFMKVATVILHVVYLGVLLIFDKGFVDKFSTDPWSVTNFCCLRSRTYMEPMLTHEEFEEKSRPYTCLDVVSCRCCC
ncbi:hypothetical protein Leryth_013001 [Lithospermum erythrorhizon]|nr:hypothetical protein Leryth_013001 [Lithospermum erythrorhizon]